MQSVERPLDGPDKKARTMNARSLILALFLALGGIASASAADSRPPVPDAEVLAAADTLLRWSETMLAPDSDDDAYRRARHAYKAAWTAARTLQRQTEDPAIRERCRPILQRAAVALRAIEDALTP